MLHTHGQQYETSSYDAGVSVMADYHTVDRLLPVTGRNWRLAEGGQAMAPGP